MLQNLNREKRKEYFGNSKRPEMDMLNNYPGTSTIGYSLPLKFGKRT